MNTALGSGTTDVIVNANLKLGSVSQTLRSLTIGPGATVTFTSGLASFIGTGKDPAFASGTNVVPEPGSVAFLAGGFTLLLGIRRRRQTMRG